MRYFWEDWGPVVSVIGVTAFIMGLYIYFGFKALAIERFCLSKGYPSAEVYIYAESYCIRRINQSDEVMPVSRLR